MKTLLTISFLLACAAANASEPVYLTCKLNHLAPAELVLNEEAGTIQQTLKGLIASTSTIQTVFKPDSVKWGYYTISRKDLSVTSFGKTVGQCELVKKENNLF